MTVSPSSTIVPDWLTRWSPFHTATLPEHIAVSDITDVADPVHANQRVEKTFTITRRPADDSADATSIHQVQVHAPGLTVVRVRPQLLDEVGDDVVARVRISSDERGHLDRLQVGHDNKHDLALKYDAKRGTLGHLVTEIDVPRASQVQQVVAMCHGDVVISDGVLASSAPQEIQVVAGLLTENAPGLLSTFGARLFLDAPQSNLKFDELFVGTFGSGSVSVIAQSLVVDKDFYGGVMGRGSVHIATQVFGSRALNLGTIGGGRLLLAAQHGFYTKGMAAYQKGDGAVAVSVPLASIIGQCVFQDVHLSGSGSIDIADVPSLETSVKIGRPTGGVARIHSPIEKLTIDSRNSTPSGAAQHVGVLPPDVRYKNPSTLTDDVLAAMSAEELVSIRQERDTTVELSSIAVPTIEDAFKTPAMLEKPREGWFLPIAVPALRDLLPF